MLTLDRRSVPTSAGGRPVLNVISSPSVAEHIHSGCYTEKHRAAAVHMHLHLRDVMLEGLTAPVKWRAESLKLQQALPQPLTAALRTVGPMRSKQCLGPTTSSPCWHSWEPWQKRRGHDARKMNKFCFRSLSHGLTQADLQEKSIPPRAQSCPFERS